MSTTHEQRRLLIEHVGRILFGNSFWEEPLAGMLGMDDRKLREWCGVAGSPPADIVRRLQKAVVEYDRCVARNAADARAALDCFEKVVLGKESDLP
jgi:hypothetical protein